jgi:hypothetical protein
MKRISIFAILFVGLSLISAPSLATTCSCGEKPPPLVEVSSAATEQSLLDRMKALFG